MKLFFTLLLLLIVQGLSAMEWPSATGVITKNFGWNDRGMPHLGFSFADNGTFGAAGDSELLFYRRQNDSASRLPSPLGSWIALDHGDGIISIYSRFDDTQNKSIAARVERGDVLGESGISGWSSRRGFYFQLFDRMGRRWINPALIIRPREDIRPPTIHSVRLIDNQGRVFDPAQTRTLVQGSYTIFVEATDTMRFANEIPLAPHRITTLLNGREIGTLTFETFFASNGSLMASRNGHVPARQVYAPVPAYEAAEIWLSRGQASLEIIVQDIVGNTRNIIFRFIVE